MNALRSIKLSLSAPLLACAALLAGCAATAAHEAPAVIEVATFKLQPGVTPDDFRPFDQAVEDGHVGRQPGFISRESAANGDDEWLVIVHWRSLKDADASMASFMTADATADFMSRLQPETMTMTRYETK